MIAQEQITVSGRVVTLRPYTERRMKQLVEIQQEIQDYIQKHPDMTLDDIDRSKVATWWKRKAEILWQSDKPLELDFFKSEDFESSLLKKSEDFFLNSRIYL